MLTYRKAGASVQPLDFCTRVKLPGQPAQPEACRLSIGPLSIKASVRAGCLYTTSIRDKTNRRVGFHNTIYTRTSHHRWDVAKRKASSTTPRDDTQRVHTSCQPQ